MLGSRKKHRLLLSLSDPLRSLLSRGGEIPFSPVDDVDDALPWKWATREQRERVGPFCAYGYDTEIAIRWNEMTFAARHFRRATSREQKCWAFDAIETGNWKRLAATVREELPARYAILGDTTIHTIGFKPPRFCPVKLTRTLSYRLLKFGRYVRILI